MKIIGVLLFVVAAFVLTAAFFVTDAKAYLMIGSMVALAAALSYGIGAATSSDKSFSDALLMRENPSAELHPVGHRSAVLTHSFRGSRCIYCGIGRELTTAGEECLARVWIPRAVAAQRKSSGLSPMLSFVLGCVALAILIIGLRIFVETLDTPEERASKKERAASALERSAAEHARQGLAEALAGNVGSGQYHTGTALQELEKAKNLRREASTARDPSSR
jgi:hypothetical protein